MRVCVTTYELKCDVFLLLLCTEVHISSPGVLSVPLHN